MDVRHGYQAVETLRYKVTENDTYLAVSQDSVGNEPTLIQKHQVKS